MRPESSGGKVASQTKESDVRSVFCPSLIEFWVLLLISFASRCLLGPFDVCLGLFENWNTKKLKLAKMIFMGNRGFGTNEKYVFVKTDSFYFRYSGVCEPTKCIFD